MVVLGIQILVHLAPEHLTSVGIVGIVEAVFVAGTYPVVDIIGGALDIHPALGI